MSRFLKAFVWFLEVIGRILKGTTMVAYRILERVAYTLGLILCLIYFGLSDPEVAQFVSKSISAGIPGNISIERIYASPLLRHFSFKDVRAHAPDGHLVAQIDNADAWFNRNQILPFFTRRLSGERLVLLEFDRILVTGGWIELDTRGEDLPLEATFSRRFLRAGEEPTDGYLRIKRAQVRGLDLTIRSSTVDIDVRNAEADATVDLIARDARIRAQSVHAESGEVRLVSQPDLPRFPFKDAQFHRVYNTNDRVEIGGFTLNTSGILVTGQGRLGHDPNRAVQAVLRADTRMDDPLLQELLPKETKVSGTGLAAAVARVEGSLEVPVVHLDLYAEDARVNDLEIRQFSGQSILEPETDATLSWLYTVPRMRVRTQHGSAEVVGVHGAYSFREYRGFRGSGTLRFRRFAATRFGLAAGLIRPEDYESSPTDVVLNGKLRSDFAYVDSEWRANANLSMNNVLGRTRRLSFRGSTLLEYAEEELTLRPRGLILEDEHMKLNISGSAAFPEGATDLQITGAIHSIKDFASPFAEIPARGQLRQVDMRLKGQLPFPTYELDCQLSNIRAGPVLPIDGKTRLKLGPDGLLHIISLNVDGEAGHASAQGTLQFLERGEYRLKKKPILNFRVVRAKLALHSHFGTQTANGYLLVDGRKLGLNLAEPIESLNGRVNVRGQHINARGVRLKDFNLQARAGPKRIRIEKFTAELERGGFLTGNGQILKRAQAVNLDVEGTAIDLLAFSNLDHKRRSPEEVLSGRINTKLKITGSVERPRLHGKIEGLDIARNRWHLDHVILRLIPLSSGGAQLESEVLPEGYLLAEPSEFRIEPNRKVLNLTLAIHGADPFDLLKPKDANTRNYKTERIKLRGEVRALFATGRRKTDSKAELSLSIPPLGFELQSEELVDPIRNTAPIKAELIDGDLWVPNLQLKMADAHVEACGVLRENGDLKLATRGEIPLTMFTTFRTVVSEGEGRAVLGGTEASVFPPELRGHCSDSLANSKGSVFTIDGPVEQPVVDGEIIFKQGMLKLTGLPEQIRFPNDWGLLVRTRGDLESRPVEILTHSGATNVLNIGEGVAQIDGVLQLKGFRPETLDLVLKGQGINYSSQNVSNMTLRTSDEKEPLIVEGRLLSDPEKRTLVTRGHVRITEGRYTRSFDALSRTVGGVFGRRMDMFSRPITETFPILANMGLEMQVVSSSFHVESPFPLGEAKLDLDMTLTVGGTLGKPAMTGLVGIRPQSTITYAFGKGRTFSITQGVIEFQGDTEHPYIDLSAESQITYAQSTDEDVSSRTQSLDFDEEETVVVTIRIEGRYPDLDIYFESDRPEFDTADIQSLILVGVPASRDSSNLDPLADTTLNFFTEDLSKALSSLLLTPFIDSVNLGVDQYGGLSAEVLAQLGRFLNVRAKIIRVGTDTRYDTGFQVKIREGVYLEGKLKVLQQEQDQTQSYEAKLKYRIPLDD